MDNNNNQPAALAPTPALAARRRLLMLLSIIFLTLFLLSTIPGDKSEEAPEEAPSEPEPGSNVANLRQVAREIAKFAAGPVFPANVSLAEHFLGHWSRANTTPDLRDASPFVTPNLSVAYGYPGPDRPLPAMPSPVNADSGPLRMLLLSLPFSSHVATLQRTEGIISFSDSPGVSLDDDPTRMEVQVAGVYVADEGLLALVASPRMTQVILRPYLLAEPPQRVLQSQPDSGAAPQSSPLPSPPLPPASSPSVAPDTPSGQLPRDISSCEIMFTFRFRPIGYDEEAAQAADAEGTDDASSDATPPLRTLAVSSATRLAGSSAHGNVRAAAPAVRASGGAVDSQQPHWWWPFIHRQLEQATVRLHPNRLVEWLGGGGGAGGTAARWQSSATAAAAVADRMMLGQQRRILLHDAPPVPPAVGEAAAAVAAARPATLGAADGFSALLSRQQQHLHRAARTTASGAKGSNSPRGGGGGAGATVRDVEEVAPASASAASAPAVAYTFLETHHRSGSIAGAPAVPAPRGLFSAPAGGGGRRLGSAPPAAAYRGAQYLALHGRATSLNCNFSLDVTVTAAVLNHAAFEAKALSYSLMATGAGVVLMGVLTFQIVRSSGATASTRISLGTMALQAAADCLLTLGHVVVGMLTPPVMSALLTAAFVYLMLFAVLEMRFMMMILKARRPEAFALGWDAVRREVGALYCRFYGLLMALLATVWALGWAGLAVDAAVLFSLWLPQIVHSAQHDTRPGLAPAYVATVSCLRLLTPLYFLACPDNLLRMLVPQETAAAAAAWAAPGWQGGFAAWLPPAPAVGALPAPGLPGGLAGAIGGGASAGSLSFATPASAAAYWAGLRGAGWLCAWVAAQAAVVLLQSKPGWGPRWFVPAVFLPQRYDYHRAVVVRGGRIVPDPDACHAWLRPRRQMAEATAAAAAAAVAGGATAAAAEGAVVTSLPRLGNRFADVGAGAREIVGAAAAAARAGWAAAVWFGRGLRLLARDWARRVQRRMGGSRHSGRGIALTAIGARSGGRRGGYERLDRSAAITPGASGSTTDQQQQQQQLDDGDDASLAAGAAAPSGSPGSGLSLAEEGRGYPAGAEVDDDGLASAAAASTALNGADAEAAADMALDDVIYAEAEAEGGAPDAALGGAPGAGAIAAPAAGPGAGAEGGGDGSASFDCVVCMDTVLFPRRRRDYMVTPCDHIFHPGCLRPWLEHKLECPTCRLVLPEP